jgi:hypothetical protein
MYEKDCGKCAVDVNGQKLRAGGHQKTKKTEARQETAARQKTAMRQEAATRQEAQERQEMRPAGPSATISIVSLTGR